MFGFVSCDLYCFSLPSFLFLFPLLFWACVNQIFLVSHFIFSTDFLFVPFLVTFLVVILKITFLKKTVTIYAQKMLGYLRNSLRTPQKRPAWGFSELLRSSCGVQLILGNSWPLSSFLTVFLFSSWDFGKRVLCHVILSCRPRSPTSFCFSCFVCLCFSLNNFY